MDFYQTLSTYYDEIFPVSEQEMQFVLDHLPEKEVSILDVGCATGEMALLLSKKGYKVYGCDLDEDMIQQGREKAKEQGQDIDIDVLDMRDLHKKYRDDYFGGIVCTGNTLVHLDSLEEMQNVLNQMYQLMHEGGRIIIQIINYDRILSKNVNTLPTIEIQDIHFERGYQYDIDNHRITFSTALEVEHQGKQQKYKSSILLYPLRYRELHGMIEKAGFHNIEAYGSFKGERYDENSYAMILTATK